MTHITTSSNTLQTTLPHHNPPYPLLSGATLATLNPQNKPHTNSYPTGPSRCFPFWQEVLACYVTNTSAEDDSGKAKCVPVLEDYYECLHHKKEVGLAQVFSSSLSFPSRHARRSDGSSDLEFKDEGWKRVLKAIQMTGRPHNGAPSRVPQAASQYQARRCAFRGRDTEAGYSGCAARGEELEG